jgi:hypothetical protein
MRWHDSTEDQRMARLVVQTSVLFSVLFPYHQEKSTGHCCQVLEIPTEFGRRDWTRTNDPHHVKVVL